MALPRSSSSAEGQYQHPFATIIAVDRDKNSQNAVKWAVENILNKRYPCVLVHVCTGQSSDSLDSAAVSKEGGSPNEEELRRFFLPFRGFCARYGIHAKEVVLYNTDVPSALIDYIVENSISNVIVGASSRNAITRKLKDADVPTSLLKSVPRSCSVYVVAKGKLQFVRSATQTNKSSISSAISTYNTTTPREHSQPGSPMPHHDTTKRSLLSRGNTGPARISYGGSNDAMQTNLHKSDRKASSLPHSAASSSSGYSLKQSSGSSNSDVSESASFQSADLSHANFEFSISSGSSNDSISQRTPNSLDAEIRRLQLELKKTMEMYDSVCGETIAAKEKARDLQQLKEAEGKDSGHAEEAALALIKAEKHKIRTAMEPAHMAKRLEQLEIQKRKIAEMRAIVAEEERKKATNTVAYNDIRCRRYSIQEIEVATDYFDSSQKIGEGGYGPVFKAVLDHTSVAIKVLRPDISHGPRQFQQEIEVLSTMRHPNMVLLLGACPEYGCLVYEYMENGSLDDCLFLKDNTAPLPWSIRFKIAAEIATALHFLHQAKPEPLVHRDLKPANILLDQNFVSKISDVGLARLVPASVSDKTTQYRLTAAAGTFCYIDPEYQQTGMLGVKSDIYSLGIMFLQIITAKPPMGLSHQVTKAIEKGRFAEVLDPNVTDWPVEEALSFAKLALKCCEMRKKDRPDLGSVILPELNRLRDLGIKHGDKGDTVSSYKPHPYSSVPQVSSPIDQINVRRRSFLSRSITSKWSFKDRQLPPTGKGGKTSSKGHIESCWSFVSCANPSPRLSKMKSFS